MVEHLTSLERDIEREMVRSVDTSILAVTAYVKQALITRRGVVTLTGQERELIIPGLSAALQPDSVQVSGIGTIAVRLLGVRSEAVQPLQPASSVITQQLNQKIAELESHQRHLQTRLESLGLQREFVQGLSQKSVEQFSQGLAHRQIDLEETRRLLNFLGEQYTELMTLTSQLEQEKQDLGQEIQKLQQQLLQIEAVPDRGSHRLLVFIEPSGPGDFVLEISYLVDHAGWTPIYDMAVSRTGRQVKVNYLAEVKQQTGEDWAGATLTLSTSELETGALWPQLHPWIIDVSSPMTELAPAALSGNLSDNLSEVGPPSSHSVSAEAIPAEAPASSTTVTKVARENGITTLQLVSGDGIAGDGTPYKVTILSEEYPCQIEYVALPRLANFVYLQAIAVNNPNGITLLSGQANIFRNHLFVGTVHLPQVAPGQKFRLNLGIDEGLKVQRQLVECQTRRKLWLNRLVTTYTYRITATNLRDREITLTMVEQLPVSRNDAVTVRLLRSVPPMQLGEQRSLEWKLALPAEANREIHYQFSVEYPIGAALVGLE